MTISRNRTAAMARRTTGGLMLALAALLPLGAAAEDAAKPSGASVIMYHRFGENDVPSTNVRLEQLEAHIAELENGGYTVMAVAEIARRLKAGETFPEKAVGVSVDDAYESVYTEAWPRFKKAGIPFTLFIATDAVDRGFTRYMNWAQIREMAKDPLVTIGSQTGAHLHMIDATAEENAADIARSQRRFKEELGLTPDLIAYPYGEFDDHVIEAAKQAGFVAGFGQHSGAFGHWGEGEGDDIFRLPRFAMNESYGDTARMRTSASALPLPVEDFTPADTVVTPAANPPAVGFTVTGGIRNPSGIACFSNQEGRLQVETLGPRVEVRMTRPLPQGRTRLNCTLPASDGRYRWLGRLLYVK